MLFERLDGSKDFFEAFFDEHRPSGAELNQADRLRFSLADDVRPGLNELTVRNTKHERRIDENGHRLYVFTLFGYFGEFDEFRHRLFLVKSGL